MTPEKQVAKILRAGIKAHKTYEPGTDGVFAMPVVPNFYFSHQWLRELKRNGQRSMWGVYFRIPDDTVVHAGHYDKKHEVVTAAQAAHLLMTTDGVQGFEVFIPRSIERQEIVKARHLPQHLGWRYFPQAHGRVPCTCDYCLKRGEIKSRSLRNRYPR